MGPSSPPSPSWTGAPSTAARCTTSSPASLDQNAYIERFNRSDRTEVLNAYLFESLAELRALTDAWLRIYNGERPHDSLGRVPPLTVSAEAFSVTSLPKTTTG